MRMLNPQWISGLRLVAMKESFSACSMAVEVLDWSNKDLALWLSALHLSYSHLMDGARFDTFIVALSSSLWVANYVDGARTQSYAYGLSAWALHIDNLLQDFPSFSFNHWYHWDSGFTPKKKKKKKEIWIDHIILFSAEFGIWYFGLCVLLCLVWYERVYGILPNYVGIDMLDGLYALNEIVLLDIDVFWNI